jgi:hypothetical protein
MTHNAKMMFSMFVYVLVWCNKKVAKYHLVPCNLNWGTLEHIMAPILPNISWYIATYDWYLAT